MRKFVMIGAAVLLGCLVFWGYGLLKTVWASGDLPIKKDNAASLDVEISFSAGDFTIRGGSDEWVDGVIETNVKQMKPVISYKRKGTVGHVEIKQKSKGLHAFRKTTNDWDLRLTNEIPVKLSVQTGVSDSKLDLAGVRLSHLSVDAGVSDTTIDLSGNWQESFDADINLGVADTTILLPKDTGVKLTVSKGLGSLGAKGLISEGNGVYVNAAYGQSDVTIDMDIDVGVGDLKIRLVE